MMKTRIARPAAVAGAVLALALAGGAAATAASAAPVHPAAPHNDCRAWEQENVRWPHPTQYRVAAECSYIDPSQKARGTLDLALQPDAHTEWFTTTGVVYVSPWRTPLAAARGVRMDYEPRY